MKVTKKLLNLLVLGSSFMLLMTGSTHAQNTGVAATESPSWAKPFGGGGIFKDGKIDLEGIISILFNLLLAAAILWVVYNIVLAGIKIAGAKEDADKRKEGLKSIVNAAIGLVVALSAYAITNTVKDTINPEANPEVGVPCTLSATNGMPGNSSNFKVGQNGVWKKDTDGVLKCAELPNT